MKKTLLIVAALALVAVGLNHAGLLPPSAEAAPKYQANMSVTDAGVGSNVVSIGKYQTIQLQALPGVLPTGNAFCLKTCTSSTCVPDCTKDFIYNRPTYGANLIDAGNVYPMIPPTGGLAQPLGGTPLIEMSSDSYVAIGSMDGGNPNVNLYLMTINPKP